MKRKSNDIPIKKSTALFFDLVTGLSPEVHSKKRMLSDMKGMYSDKDAYEIMLDQQDSLIYEFYELGIPKTPHHLAYGTTILYPGKVGNEYFMTKGHFHQKLATAEVYYCIKGHGMLLMENPMGNVEIQKFSPGIAVYVPPNYAHRSINTSSSGPLISFFAFRADAGHDYKTIETKGFRKLIVEQDGKPKVIDNPNWNR
ncbi:MAG: glucose-6-phosphate isomerase [Candidatus Lokiarchaeota archaeon]|nr:glucose-6-phosphate isomerase [Candidatus Lokiarchaeota archaeon]